MEAHELSSSSSVLRDNELQEDCKIKLWKIRVAEAGDGKSETRWFLIAQINLVLILAILVGTGVAGGNLGAGPAEAIATGVAGVASILIFAAFALGIIWWFSRRDIRYVSKGLVAERLVELAPRAADVNEEIESLCARMGLIHKMRLLIDRRDASCSAAAIDLGRAPVIVMSLGLLALYRKDRDAARAIVAHEISHIVQGDSRNWRFPYAVFRFFVFLLALNWLVAIVDAATKSTSAGTFLLAGALATASVALPAILQLPWFLKIRGFRWRSEKTADLAALAFVNFSAMERALGGFPKKGLQLLSSHPDPSKRIVALRHAEKLQPSQVPQQPRLKSEWAVASAGLVYMVWTVFLAPFVGVVGIIHILRNRGCRYGYPAALFGIIVGSLALIPFLIPMLLMIRR